MAKNTNYNKEENEIWNMILEEVLDCDYRPSSNSYNESGYPDWYNEFN